MRLMKLEKLSYYAGMVILLSLAGNSIAQEESKAADIVSRISESPAFQRWFAYWQEHVPDMSLDSLTNTVHFKPPPAYKWSKTTDPRIIDVPWERDFILSFSPDSTAFADLYFMVETERSGDSLNIVGIDIDSGFRIVDTSDSSYYIHTMGPGSSYHECVWLSDDTAVIIGMHRNYVRNRFDYVVVYFREFNLKEKSIDFYRSRQLPGRFNINGLDYLLYKYPGRVIMK